MTPLTFSVIVPVYNRPDEVDELLRSLAAQTVLHQPDAPARLEVVIVEDGSTRPCRDVCERWRREGLDVKYFAKENEGRSPARNYGIERSGGQWLVFVDSDVVVPPGYFAALAAELAKGELDCYGGPDAAHASFTPTQKAINYAMTSFLTTGGIRGGKVQLEKFVPRTFNMGFRREVYDRVGGFREMFSEDIDMSMRIRAAGFRIGLVRQCAVWHRRRTSLPRFWRQVHVFGQSRVTLHQLYPGSLKAVHLLPALAVVGALGLFVLACLCSPWWLLPLGVYLLAIFWGAWIKERSLRVAALAVPAAVIQLGGYGTGFIRAWTRDIVMRRGRDLGREVEIRKGANEKL